MLTLIDLWQTISRRRYGALRYWVLQLLTFSLATGAYMYAYTSENTSQEVLDLLWRPYLVVAMGIPAIFTVMWWWTWAPRPYTYFARNFPKLVKVTDKKSLTILSGKKNRAAIKFNAANAERDKAAAWLAEDGKKIRAVVARRRAELQQKLQRAVIKFKLLDELDETTVEKYTERWQKKHDRAVAEMAKWEHRLRLEVEHQTAATLEIELRNPSLGVAYLRRWEKTPETAPAVSTPLAAETQRQTEQPRSVSRTSTRTRTPTSSPRSDLEYEERSSGGFGWGDILALPETMGNSLGNQPWWMVVGIALVSAVALMSIVERLLPLYAMAAYMVILAATTILLGVYFWKTTQKMRKIAQWAIPTTLMILVIFVWGQRMGVDWQTKYNEVAQTVGLQNTPTPTLAPTDLPEPTPDTSIEVVEEDPFAQATSDMAITLDTEKGGEKELVAALAILRDQVSALTYARGLMKSSNMDMLDWRTLVNGKGDAKAPGWKISLIYLKQWYDGSLPENGLTESFRTRVLATAAAGKLDAAKATGFTGAADKVVKAMGLLKDLGDYGVQCIQVPVETADRHYEKLDQGALEKCYRSMRVTEMEFDGTVNNLVSDLAALGMTSESLSVSQLSLAGTTDQMSAALKPDETKEVLVTPTQGAATVPPTPILPTPAPPSAAKELPANCSNPSMLPTSVYTGEVENLGYLVPKMTQKPATVYGIDCGGMIIETTVVDGNGTEIKSWAVVKTYPAASQGWLLMAFVEGSQIQIWQVDAAGTKVGSAAIEAYQKP